MSLSRLIILLSICFYASFTIDAQTRPSNRAKEYKPNAAEKSLLSALPEDEKRFAEFLKTPDTGLFRIFPRQLRKQVVSVADLESGKRPGFNDYACLYSFSKRKHGQDADGMSDPGFGWAELKLQDGMFVSGFMKGSLGLLFKIGDVPLETVTRLTDGVSVLSDFVHQPDQTFFFGKHDASVYMMKKFMFRSSLPASVNATYALRAIAYGRADILVGFRVIRQDDDGSLTVLWKKLRDYPKPSLKSRAKQ